MWRSLSKKVSEIQKQIDPEEADESEFEQKEFIVTFLERDGVSSSHCSWQRGVSAHWLEQAGYTNNYIKTLWGCLLANMRFLNIRSGLCVTGVHCMISSSHLQRLVHRHRCCCTLQKITERTGLQFKRNFLCLKLSFVCQISYFP
jgi:hypothetical protein